jgi:ribonuclease VapC
MIIATSALIALITGKDDAADLESILNQAPIRRISAANYVEAGIVMDGRRDPVLPAFWMSRSPVPASPSNR